MSKLFISERQTGDSTILDLKGDVIYGESGTVLRTAVRRLLAEGKTNILLDFEKVGYLDSSGVGELLSALTAVRRENGTLRLQHLSERVYKLLDVCKLLTVFEGRENEIGAAGHL